jgi:hypothetical protein
VISGATLEATGEVWTGPRTGYAMVMNPFPDNTVEAQRPVDRAILATTPDYGRAQSIVDELSDSGFPVDRLQIVWDGLRRVEHVTGRLTTWRAVGAGALAGAWFGGLFGWLFAMFSTEGWAVFLTYLVVGAVAGAIWKGVGHALQRGRRDFDTVSTVAAHEYQVWCDTELLGRAHQVLGTSSHHRAIDPEPSQARPS